MVSARFFLVGQGPRSARPTSIGRKIVARAAIRVRPITLRRVSLDSSTTLSSWVSDPGHVLRLGGGAVPVVDHLLVVHQRAGPLHGADADEQQRQPERQAEAQVAGVGAQRTEVEEPVPGHREVDDGEADGQHRHQPEEGGDLAGRPVGGLLVDIGQPGQVLVVSRVRNREPVVRVAVVHLDQVVARIRARRAVVAHLAFAPFAAIQIAKNIKVPSPTIQAHRPSLTGPRPPRARPPSLGRSCRSFR